MATVTKTSRTKAVLERCRAKIRAEDGARKGKVGAAHAWKVPRRGQEIE